MHILMEKMLAWAVPCSRKPQQQISYTMSKRYKEMKIYLLFFFRFD